MFLKFRLKRLFRRYIKDGFDTELFFPDVLEKYHSRIEHTAWTERFWTRLMKNELSRRGELGRELSEDEKENY